MTAVLDMNYFASEVVHAKQILVTIYENETKSKTSFKFLLFFAKDAKRSRNVNNFFTRKEQKFKQFIHLLSYVSFKIKVVTQ